MRPLCPGKGCLPVRPARSWLQVKVHQWVSPKETQRMRYFAPAWGTNSHKQPRQQIWKTKILWNVWPQPLFLYSVFLRERQWGHSDEWPFQRKRAGRKQGDLEKNRLKKEKNHISHYSLQDHPTFPSHLLPWLLLLCPPEQLQWAWGDIFHLPSSLCPRAAGPPWPAQSHSRHCCCPGEPDTAQWAGWEGSIENATLWLLGNEIQL